MEVQFITVAALHDVSRLSVTFDSLEGVEEQDWYLEWEALVLSDPDSSLLQHPGFLLHEVFERPDTQERPVIVIREETAQGEVLAGALAPIKLEQRFLFGALPTARVPAYRLAGHKFFGNAREKNCVTLLDTVATLLKPLSSWLLLIEDVEHDVPLAEQIYQCGKNGLVPFRVAEPQPKHRTVLPASAEEYFASLSTSRMKQYRRLRRKFSELSMTVFEAPETVDRFLADAKKVSEQSWQAKVYGLRVKNSPEEKTLFRYLARKGFLRSYMLYSDGEPVAFEVAYQFRDYMWGVEVGYDPKFSKSSPGNLLLIQEFEDLFARNTPATYDFGKGDAPYKQVFSNQTTESADYWLVRSDFSGAIWRRLTVFNRAFEKLVHGVLDSLGIRALARRLYRRLGR